MSCPGMLCLPCLFEKELYKSLPRNWLMDFPNAPGPQRLRTYSELFHFSPATLATIKSMQFLSIGWFGAEAIKALEIW